MSGVLVSSNGSSGGGHAGLGPPPLPPSNVNGVSNDSTAEIRRLQDEVNQLTKRNGGTTRSQSTQHP